MTIPQAINPPNAARPRLWPLALTIALLATHSAAAQSQATSPDGHDQEAGATTATAATIGVVNINTASAEELMRLPGVGPAKANAILALRDKLKGFPRVAAIMRVRGIGRKTYAKLKPMLAIEGPTTLLGKGKRGDNSQKTRQEHPNATPVAVEDQQ